MSGLVSKIEINIDMNWKMLSHVCRVERGVEVSGDRIRNVGLMVVGGNGLGNSYKERIM